MSRAEPLEQSSRAPPQDDKPYERASVWLAVCVLLAMAGTLESGDLRPFAVIGMLSLLALAQRLRRLEPIRSYWPTLITLARLLLTAVLAYAGTSFSPLAVVLIVLVVFSSDGLDGYLARRLAAESKLGARLDAESDAFLIMSLSLLLWTRGHAGAWVLTAGLLRYVYVLVVAVLSARGEVPRSAIFRYAFAIAVAGLSAGFAVPGPASAVGPALATATLVLSFARSFRYSLSSTREST